MLEINNISRHWDSFSLKQVSLKINPGEYLVLLGPSGSGKTLLLETIAGIYQPEKGKIFINGKEVTSLVPEKRNTGLLYQEYLLFPHLNVRENIAYGLRYQKGISQPRKQTECRLIESVAELVNLGPILDRQEVDLLSGGEKQKIALARILMVEPAVLLLDEPMRSLDYSSRGLVYEILKDICRKKGIPILHVTHDYSEATALADWIAVINQGELVQVGRKDEVFKKPKSEFVASFLGVTP